MIRETYADRHHHPPLLESGEILIAAVLMFAGWFAWYVGRERYFLTARQLAEFTTYLIIAAFAFVSTVALLATRDVPRTSFVAMLSDSCHNPGRSLERGIQCTAL